MTHASSQMPPANPWTVMLPCFANHELSAQHHHAFQVACLWKQVKGLNSGELIACTQEVFEITHLGSRVAGNINHLTWPIGKKLVKELTITALARRVDDHGCLVCGEGNILKDRLRTGGEEGGIVDLVELSITPRPISRSFTDLNTGDLFELMSKAE